MKKIWQNSNKSCRIWKWTKRVDLLRWKAANVFSGFFVFSTLLISACQTTPSREESFKDGVVWRYQADIYIDQNKQSNKVQGFLDIVEGVGFRLEVLSMAEVPVATVVMTEQEVNYALHLDKVFYSGKTNPHALDPVFHLPVRPREIEAIFREQALPEQKCVKDQSQQFLSCTAQSPVSYEVLWEKRGIAGPLAGKATKITLRMPSDHMEIRFYIKNINRGEPSKGLLLLTPPKDFSARKVPEK